MKVRLTKAVRYFKCVGPFRLANSEEGELPDGTIVQFLRQIRVSWEFGQIKVTEFFFMGEIYYFLKDEVEGSFEHVEETKVA